MRIQVESRFSTNKQNCCLQKMFEWIQWRALPITRVAKDFPRPLIMCVFLTNGGADWKFERWALQRGFSRRYVIVEGKLIWREWMPLIILCIIICFNQRSCCGRGQTINNINPGQCIKVFFLWIEVTNDSVFLGFHVAKEKVEESIIKIYFVPSHKEKVLASCNNVTFHKHYKWLEWI